MSTSLFMLTASFISPDDTDTPHDVLAAAEVNGVHEVYPENLADGAGGDFGPAWVEPQAAGVLTTAQIALLLDSITIGVEGAYDEGTNTDADAVALWVETVRANVDLTTDAEHEARDRMTDTSASI